MTETSSQTKTTMIRKSSNGSTTTIHRRCHQRLFPSITNSIQLLALVLAALALALTISPCNGFSSNSNPSSPPPSNNSNSNNNINSNIHNKHITSSQRIRYEEEQRRISRRNENIPGKTSAIPNAQDLPLNIDKTQNEWYNQASSSEKQIKEYTDAGMRYLKGLELEKANDAFDKVFELKPNSYCWQAGIVKFYLNQYHDAAECFVNCAHVYESRFGMFASEERIWRDACELKIKHLGLASSKKTSMKKRGESNNNENRDGRELSFNVAQMRRDDDDVSFGQIKETRKVVRIAKELFSSSIKHDLSNEALARGKLRSICGEYDSNSSSTLPFKMDKKMWRLNSWFYLGLHYDVLDDKDSSKDCMKMALRQSASSFGNGDDSK